MTSSSKTIPFLILAAALFLRLGYVLHEPVSAAVRPDSSSFTLIGHHLATLDEFSLRPPELTAYRPPGYPVFLAALELLVGPSTRAILVAQALLGTGVVFGVMFLARRLSAEPKVYWLAGALAAIYPFFIYYDGSVLAESLLTFSMTAAMVAYAQWKDHSSTVLWGVLCVASWAFLSLLKTIFAPVFLLSWAYEFYHHAAPRRWLVLAFILFELPSVLWGWRNHELFGRSLIDSHGGQTCFECIVYYDINKKGIFSDTFHGNPIEVKGEGLNEADRDQFYFGLTKAFIREHPVRYAHQCLSNFKDFWRFYPRQDLSFAEGSHRVTIISLITEPFLLLAGLVGAWKARRYWENWFPAILSVLALTAIHTATCAQMRYRLPLMPLAIVLASYAVVRRSRHD